MEEPQSLDGRLGKLEGLMIGLQASITQSQQSFAGHTSRVESLERRQVELERQMITKDDLNNLMKKVDHIATQQSANQGGNEAAKWSAQQVAQWAAVIIALGALFVSMKGFDGQDAPNSQPTNQR